MSILIIGSGLSALAVYKALKDSGRKELEIYLMDTNLRNEGVTKKIDNVGAQKTHFGSSHMYQSINYNSEHKMNISFSYAAGGLSTVWGAGIRLWDESIVNELQIENLEFFQSAVNLLSVIPYYGNNQTLNIPDHMPIKTISEPYKANAFDQLPVFFKSKEISVFNTPLAVVTQGMNGCKNCGNCLSGCPYGSIFDTESFFDREEARKNLEIIQGKVTQIVPFSNMVEVKYKTKANDVEIKNFNQVYLCAGAVGTPAILMESKLIESEVIISDSQVFYFVGLYKGRKRDENIAFSLSQKTITDSQKFSASIYECNTEVRERISSAISQKLFGLRLRLPKLLDRFIFVGIGFLDSNSSGKIKLEVDANKSLSASELPSERTAKAVRESVKEISRFFRRYGLWVIPRLTQTPAVGAGFHSGAGLPLNSTNVDSEGRLRGTNNIFIADPSLLEKIYPGSHTMNSMALNYSLIVRRKK